MRTVKLSLVLISACLWALPASGDSIASASSQNAPPLTEASSSPNAKSTEAPASNVEVMDSGWPREVAYGDVTLLIYQPQLETWQGNRLEALAAVAAKPKDAPAPSDYGVVWLTARTEVDKVNRQVTLDNLEFTHIEFPGPKEKAKEYADVLRSRAPDKTRVISLDRLEAALAASDAAEKVQSFDVKNDPPRILYSNVPALLVLIDGDPVLRPMEGLGLQRVINTRVLIVFDAQLDKFYLHLMDGWLEASALDAGWSVARNVSTDLKKAEKTAAASQQIDMLDGPPISEDGKTRQTLKDAARSATVPVIHVSFAPAELIQTAGAPQTTGIPGTGLLWVSNSANNLFVDPRTNSYYVLLSGRWFRSRSFDAPWEYVPGARLPEEFARIPADHPKASVLACVPGTAQAKEAVIANSIPQTAAIDRATTKLEVQYDGDPKFADVDGASLQYAVNSKTPVIRVSGETYYAVENAVWFVGPSPFGPWTVATTAPAVLYTVPPSSALHYVTYVRIYGYDDKVVYVGYTPGYYGTVVTTEHVVVYGTGWYYPPYIGGWWYGWPCTYGYGATTVWSTGGGWAIGFGVGYGWGWYHPYWGPWGWPGYVWAPVWGWGAWGGYASANIYGRWGAYNYAATKAAWANPWTGNYGAGARYGAYNPATGAVATGGRFINTNIYTGNTAAGRGGAAYNPETGRVIAGGAGYAGNIYTGEVTAGRGGLVYDTDTKTGMAIGKNNVYAGKNGDVYKYDRSSGSWYHRDNDSWNPVDPPRSAPTDTAGEARDRSKQTVAQGNTQNLQRERQARSQGEHRSQQYRSSSGNWSRGRAGGGGRRR